MKFCQQHWDRLKDLIREAGLYKYVAESGEDLAKRLDREFTIPDPLFSCHNNLTAFALKNGGLYLMGQDENGNDYCPMCECKKAGIDGKLNEALDEQWMKSEVNAAKNWYIEKGLLNDAN